MHGAWTSLAATPRQPGLLGGDTSEGHVRPSASAVVVRPDTPSIFAGVGRNWVALDVTFIRLGVYYICLRCPSQGHHGVPSDPVKTGCVCLPNWSRTYTHINSHRLSSNTHHDSGQRLCHAAIRPGPRLPGRTALHLWPTHCWRGGPRARAVYLPPRAGPVPGHTGFRHR